MPTCPYCRAAMREKTFPSINQTKTIGPKKVAPPAGGRDLNIYQGHSETVVTPLISGQTFWLCDNCNGVWRAIDQYPDKFPPRPSPWENVNREDYEDYERRWEKARSQPDAIEVKDPGLFASLIDAIRDWLNS